MKKQCIILSFFNKMTIDKQFYAVNCLQFYRGDLMTVNRVQLSTNDILEKEFKKSMRGYNEEEVDEFLDIIIQDYEALNQEIERLRQENERFKKSSEQQPATRKQTTGAQVNYDVLKRLSNLEKAVFGQKLNEKEG